MGFDVGIFRNQTEYREKARDIPLVDGRFVSLLDTRSKETLGAVCKG